MHPFYELLELIKTNKIRKGDYIGIHRTNFEICDYYEMTDKDLVSLISGDYLFDNYYLLELMKDATIEIIWSKERKEKVLKSIEENEG